MADDASYNSFLSKANEPVSDQTQSTSQNRSKHDPTESNASAPASISSLLSNNPTYTSETDSSFSPVYLSYAGDGLPSAADFSTCLEKSHTSSSGDVEELSVKEFDPRGEYKSVIEAVGQAGKKGKGDVKVYRVEGKGSRVEYYVVTVAEDGGKLVGVTTMAVES